MLKGWGAVSGRWVPVKTPLAKGEAGRWGAGCGGESIVCRGREMGYAGRPAVPDGALGINWGGSGSRVF